MNTKTNTIKIYGNLLDKSPKIMSHMADINYNPVHISNNQELFYFLVMRLQQMAGTNFNEAEFAYFNDLVYIEMPNISQDDIEWLNRITRYQAFGDFSLNYTICNNVIEIVFSEDYFNSSRESIQTFMYEQN